MKSSPRLEFLVLTLILNTFILSGVQDEGGGSQEDSVNLPFMMVKKRPLEPPL